MSYISRKAALDDPTLSIVAPDTFIKCRGIRPHDFGSILSVAGPIIGGLISSDAQSSAANTAAGAQTASAAQGIAEQRRQFDAIQTMLQPYVAAGTGALTGQQNLLGLNGAPAQQSAYDMLQASPAFTSLTKTGENAILQNASATGGLRGGNTQAALAQFRPALLSQLIQQQFQNLGGLTSLGQNAAAGVGNAGMNTGNQVTSLLAQQGAAQAGAALAGGRAQSQVFGSLGGGLGLFAGLGGFNGLGGSSGSGYQSIAQSGANGYIDPINYSLNYG